MRPQAGPEGEPEQCAAIKLVTQMKMYDSMEEVVIFAPEDVREYRAVPLPGETPEQTELFDRAWQTLLDRYDYRPIKL